MKLRILASTGLILAMGFISCEDQTNHKSSEKQTEAPSARKAYNFTGKYEGTLPCKDCKGIALSLTLKEDQKFRLIESFVGGSKDGSIETKTGNFSWNANDSIITLNTDSRQKFLVEENHLMMVNESGMRIRKAGKLLMLSKTKDSH